MNNNKFHTGFQNKQNENFMDLIENEEEYFKEINQNYNNNISGIAYSYENNNNNNNYDDFHKNAFKFLRSAHKSQKRKNSLDSSMNNELNIINFVEEISNIKKFLEIEKYKNLVKI